MKGIFITLIKITILFFCAFVFFSFLWIKESVWELTFGQIIFHLLMPIEGAEKEILLSFKKNVLKILIYFLIIYTIMKLLLKKLPYLDKYSSKFEVFISLIFLLSL